MRELGFRRNAATTSILHPDTAFLVEFPAPPLSIGNAPVFRVGTAPSDRTTQAPHTYAVCHGQAGGVLSLE